MSRRSPAEGRRARARFGAVMQRVVVTALVSMFALPMALACEAPAGPTTYRGSTKAIFDAKCATCHREGGIGPMSFTTYEEITGLHDLVRGAIESGLMPPWQAADGCNEYANDFSLTDDEQALIFAWMDAGMPEGDEPVADAPADIRDPLASGIRYDVIFDAASEPFTPVRNDNYRCYAIPWPYEDGKY